MPIAPREIPQNVQKLDNHHFQRAKKKIDNNAETTSLMKRRVLVKTSVKTAKETQFRRVC